MSEPSLRGLPPTALPPFLLPQSAPAGDGLSQLAADRSSIVQQRRRRAKAGPARPPAGGPGSTRAATGRHHGA
jgi:hypothetical protein